MLPTYAIDLGKPTYVVMRDTHKEIVSRKV